MKLTPEKRVSRLLAFVAIVFFAVVPIYAFELLSGSKPFDFQITGIANLSTPLFCLSEGVVLLVFSHLSKKLAPNVLAKRLGLYEIITMPILAILVLVLCLFYPPAASSWLYFLNLGVTIFLFGVRLFLVFFFNALVRKGQDGYIAFKNHSLIAVLFFFMVILYYCVPYLKTIGFDGGSLIDIIREDGDIASLPIPYLLTSLAEIIIAIAVLAAMIYLSLATWISGREDKAFDLKGNFSVTMEMLQRYDLLFWVGIFSTFMMMLSLASAIALMGSYFTLFFLYVTILALKVPNYFWRRKIVKKYGSDYYGCFQAEHKMLLYSAILLFVYIGVSYTFGGVSAVKQNENKSALMTFAIFIPMALIKMALGIKKYLKARKNGEPYDLLNAYLDILFAIFTFSNTAMIAGNATGLDVFKIIGVSVAGAMALYTIYLAVKLLVISVWGIRGKRQKYYDAHKGVMHKEGFLLAEDLADAAREQRESGKAEK